MIDREYPYNSTQALFQRLQKVISNGEADCYMVSSDSLKKCLLAEIGYREQKIEVSEIPRLDEKVGQLTDEYNSAQRVQDIKGIEETIDKMILFIDKLPDISEIEKENYDEAYERHRIEDTVVVLGDSHVNFFSGNELLAFRPIGQDINICPPENGFPFTCLHLGPCLAYNSNKYGTGEKFLEKLEWLMKNFIKNGSKVVVSLGEIDIRCHVYKQTQLQNRPYTAIVDDILDNYIDMLIYIQEHGYKVYVWGPISSQRDDAGEVEGLPAIGSEKERNIATRYFTDNIRKRLLEHGIEFMTIFEQIVSINYETDKKYICEDKCHLSQSAFDLAIRQWERAGII